MELTENTQPAETPNQSNARKWWIAGIMSLFIPGLGQIYNGQIKKGIAMILAFQCIVLCAVEFPMITSFSTLIIWVVIAAGIKLFSLFDAIIIAIRLKVYHLKKWNSWYVYASIFILFSINGWIYSERDNRRMIGFSIPGESSLPTFEVGDNVMCNTRFYDKHEPNYGDVITFLAVDDLIYTFRIIGLPNDTIDIKNNEVKINSTPAEYILVEKKKKIRSMYELYFVDEYIEKLPNGHEHHIYMNNNMPDDSTFVNNQYKVLAWDEYYVLGDNRNRAMDSRFLGPINKKDIQGKMEFIYYSKNINRIGKNINR